MEINVKINGVCKQIFASPGENAQELLKREGCISVRDSDDHQGFAGSDAILLDGKIVNAGVLIAAQLDGKTVKTPEALSKNGVMSPVQSAMVDAGVVQSAYNAPAAALILTDLLERIANPSKEEIKDALSGIFIRDVGYEQYYGVVELAKERLQNPDAPVKTVAEYRDECKVIGKTGRKVDGPQLVMGQKAFVEDRVQPDRLIVKLMKSPHAHAYIKSIDVSEAEKMDGVALVITKDNCPDFYFSQAGQGAPEPSPYDRKMFGEKVRHVGDRVAAVIAETAEIALAAIETIKVEYEVLKPVFTIDQAEAVEEIVQNGELVFHGDAPENIAELQKNGDQRGGQIGYPFPIGMDPHKNVAASVSGGIGDVEKGFADADVVIEREYETSQIQCTPLETHVCYTRMEGDRLICHTATQVPWYVRRNLAKILGLSENKIQVIKERVGGGYGAKQDILIEDICAYATLQTGRSCYFHYTREEEFISNSTRHTFKIRVKIGATKEGKMTAIYSDVKANTGPYGAHCLTVPMNACSKTYPLLSCDNMSFDVKVFYSNIYPTGAYQGYGAPQGSYAVQMAMCEMAKQLNIDPLDFINNNRVTKGSVLEILKCLGEGTEGAVATCDSCGLDDALKEGADMINWGQKVVSDDPDVKIGKGVVMIQQGSGIPGLDQSNGRVTLLSDGSIMVHSGGADLGTGLDTVCAKIASEILCTDMKQITVLSGDTDNTPFDSGAYASSGTYFVGNACKLATEDLRDKILAAASTHLEEDVKDLEIIAPSTVKGKKGEISFAAIAAAAESGTGIGQIVGNASYTTHDSAFPYGAHFAQVAVNTRTGAIDIQKYYALMDCGTPINPELAEGQVYGGVLKTIGHSLWENLQMDEKGQCLNPDLRTYGVPMIGDQPEDFKVKLIYVDDPYGPYGAKSVSECATNAAAPVIANAIHDAVGLWIRKWPFTPEKILKGLNKIN